MHIEKMLRPVIIFASRSAALLLLILSVQPADAAIAFRAASSASVQTQVGVSPSLIQRTTGNAGASGDVSLTINKPAGTLTGHVMLAQITIKGVVAAITPPGNWSLIDKSSTSTSGSAITQAVYWHVAVAGEPASYTWSWAASARATGGITTFSNVETSNPVDVFAVRTTNSSTTITIPGITTTSGNDMLLALLGSSATSAHSTPAGMNENYDVATGAGPNGVTVSNDTFLQVNPGAVAAKTATTGSAVDNIAHMIALRPLGGLTINVPTGTTVGDVMIASVSYRPCSNTSGGNCTTTILPPAGWIQVNSVTDQKTGGGTDGYGNRLFVYQRVVTGVEPASYTWYFGGTPMQAGAAGGIASFSGVDTVTPIDAQAGQTTASSRTHTAPGITTTVANTMLVSSHLINSSGTWTPPAGMTERVDVASRTPANDLGITLGVNTEARAAIGATGTRAATASNPPAADTGITHMLALRPLSTGFNHLEIQHATGEGLTCAASTLIIKACADAACTTLYTGGVIGTLSATGTPAVNWDGTTGSATGAGFVIASGSSTVTKNFQVAAAGSVVLGISSPAPVPSNATTCNFGAPACTFTADVAGFVVSDSSAGSGYTIPAQVSGIATPTLYLRALQASTTNPAVCTPAIVSSTTSVEMGYACNNPASCQAGSLATITNTTTGTATAIAPGGTSVSLDFDANGSAPMTVRYDDVGLITLNASKTVTPFGGATAVTLDGSSNSYVVAPHHFGFSAVSAGPIKAGNNFSATVTAYNGLATPTATANFGKESAAESTTITFSKCKPSGTNAVNGSFTGSVGSFNNGAASASDLNWSEVGNGDLVATLASGSYLSSGLTASGNTGTSGTVCNGGGAGNVGAFIPDHFITTVTDGCAGCGFTYSGQPFTVVVTAQNGLATPGTTANYDGTANTAPNFANDVSLTDANAATPTPVGKFGVSAAAMGVTVNLAGDTLTVPKADFVSGVATLTLVPTYTFNVTPTVPTTVKIHAEDAVYTSLTSSGFTEGTTEIRSGRIKISNAYGSELLQLPMLATVQYYNALGVWVTSTTDSVTGFNTATNLVTAIVKGPLAGVSVKSAGPVTVMSGVRTFTLNSPGVTGSADISLNAPTYLPSLSGRASFGVYKGGNDFIYQRESY